MGSPRLSGTSSCTPRSTASGSRCTTTASAGAGSRGARAVGCIVGRGAGGASPRLGFWFLPRFVPLLCTKGGERGARERRSEDYGSVRVVAAPGTPSADPRASSVNTLAAHGTPWADPRASTVSSVAAPGAASADPRASTVSTLAAHGAPWADPRASTVSRVAAPGTASADPRASTVSRVAPARNVGVSKVLVFISDTL